MLNDAKIRKQYKEKVIELDDIGAPNLWGHFNDGILKACDEVCGKRKRRSIGDTWWWNEDVKEAVDVRCAGVKIVTNCNCKLFSRNITCRKCEENIGEAVEQEEKLCDEVERVQKFTYLGDSECRWRM